MICADARTLIHLDAGGDLRAEELVQLSQHVGGCEVCREYQSGMSQSLNVLRTLRSSELSVDQSGSETQSVWPSVLQAISRRNILRTTTRRFNLQVAALSVCSLSLAVVTIVQSLSSFREATLLPRQYQSQPVANPRQWNPDVSRDDGGRERLPVHGGEQPSAADTRSRVSSETF